MKGLVQPGLLVQPFCQEQLSTNVLRLHAGYTCAKQGQGVKEQGGHADMLGMPYFASVPPCGDCFLFMLACSCLRAGTSS